MAKGPLACMKKTQRDKDWPYVHQLAIRMASEGDKDALLHLQDASSIRETIMELGEPDASLLSKRPLLDKAGKVSDDQFDELIRTERQFWQKADNIRLGMYRASWRPYAVAVGKLPKATFSGNLLDQHHRLVELAANVLAMRPLDACGGEEGLYNLTKNKLNENGIPSSFFPGPPPFNRFT